MTEQKATQSPSFAFDTRVRFHYRLRHSITGMEIMVTFDYGEVYSGLCYKMLTTGLYSQYNILGVSFTDDRV